MLSRRRGSSSFKFPGPFTTYSKVYSPVEEFLKNSFLTITLLPTVSFVMSPPSSAFNSLSSLDTRAAPLKVRFRFWWYESRRSDHEICVAFSSLDDVPENCRQIKTHSATSCTMDFMSDRETRFWPERRQLHGIMIFFPARADSFLYLLLIILLIANRGRGVRHGQVFNLYLFRLTRTELRQLRIDCGKLKFMQLLNLLHVTSGPRKKCTRLS